MDDSQNPVLVCKDLCVSYYTRAGEIPAVVDFSLTVMPGETIGIVGESGCGKSTVAMAIMQYMGNNGGIKSGSITFKGRDLTKLTDDELRGIRGSDIAMIYQEPFASLNPSLKISTQLMEVPLAHENISAGEARQRAVEMLAENTYHAVVTDMKMPGMTGIHLYKIIREKHPELSANILFITGDVLGRDTQDFLLETGAPYVEKPFQVNLFLMRLHNMLSAES